MMLLPFAQDRQELLHQKEGRADVDGEQPVEILDGGVLDRRWFRDAGIGDEDVETIADNVAGQFCQLVRAVGRSEIGDTASARPPAFADFGDDRIGFLRAAP